MVLLVVLAEGYGESYHANEHDVRPDVARGTFGGGGRRPQVVAQGRVRAAVGGGSISYLPLARRSIGKIEGILREEMDAVGGQEVSMPVVQPAEVWKRSGRYGSTGRELVRLRDRRDRELVLAMTHEEIVAGLAAGEVDSYQRLPRLVYQIQTKFRDDPRPRAGLIRAREFTMKDAYSLDRDEEGLDKQYRALYEAYFRIFARCGLPAIAVGAESASSAGACPTSSCTSPRSGRTPSSSATAVVTRQTARWLGSARRSRSPKSGGPSRGSPRRARTPSRLWRGL